MADDAQHPRLVQTAIDTDQPRVLAEFYRRLLGLQYRPGDEPPASGPDDADWIVLTRPDGTRALAIQQATEHVPPTWPDPGVPQQLHVDMAVDTREQLIAQRDRVLELGGTLLLDQLDDPEEALYVFADPAGHPFCIFVSPAD